MPNVAIDSIISIAADSRLDDQQILLTTHWKLTTEGGFSGPDLHELYTAVAAELDVIGGFRDTLVACYSNEVNMGNWLIQVISNTRYVRHQTAMTTATGGVASAAEPPNVCHVITLRTDDTGRDQVSNKHVGGTPGSFTEGGYITATGRDALIDLKNFLSQDLTVNIGGEDFILKPVIFHKNELANPSLITSGSVQDTTRVMRRRTVGRGS